MRGILRINFNSPLVNLDQLMPVLAQVTETLTELRITGVSLCGTPPRLQGSARALAGYDQLTKLFIPLVFFTGFALPLRSGFGNCLPRNLEELTLTDDLSLTTSATRSATRLVPRKLLHGSQM